MSRYQLTDAQRRDWEALVERRFQQRNNFALAKEMDLDPAGNRGGKDYHKNVSGYIGDFRRGEKRGLTYFFETQSRLVALAAACGCTAEDLHTDLRTVLRVDRIDDDFLWLSGFEDLGPVHFDDGFVLPPVFGPTDRLDAPGLLARLHKATSRSSSVSGDAGAGVSTLIRWLVRQSVGEGWRPARWEGELPSGRAIVLAADPDDGLDDLQRRGGGGFAAKRTLQEWLQEGQHRLVRANSGGLWIGPVDLPWLKAFGSRVQQRAGKRLKFGSLNDHVLAEIAEARVGPEEAGLRIRDRMDAVGATRNPPSSLKRLEAAARRRLHARDESDAGLAAFTAWFPDFTLETLRDPENDPVALINGSVLVEAGRLLTHTQRLPPELDLLRACLPILTGEASLAALRGSGLLAEAAGKSRVRLLGYAAPALAERVRDDATILRRCLVERHRSLLRAVAATPTGPAAIVTALDRLDAPSLMLATAMPDADWLRGLVWTERLVARVLAIAELTGIGQNLREALRKLDKVLDDDAQLFDPLNPKVQEERKRRLASADSPLRVPLAEAQLPSLDIMAVCWREVGVELGISVPDPTPARMQQARALHLARREDLVDPSVWDSLPHPLGFPPCWFEVARHDLEVAKVALNPKPERPSTQGNDRRKIGSKDLLADASVAAALIPWLSRSALEYLGKKDPNDWIKVSAQLRPLASVRRDPAIAEALRQAVRDWETIACSEDEPRDIEDLNQAIEGLVSLLRAMPQSHRVAWLRTPGGHVGPLWREAVEAGVPDQDLLALWQGTLDGSVRWPAPWSVSAGGEHVGKTVEHARELLFPMLLAHVDVAALEGAGVLPARPQDLAPQDFAKAAKTPNTRTWIWSKLEGIDDEEPFWRLLEDKASGNSHFDLLEGMPSKGKPGELHRLLAHGWLLSNETRESIRTFRKLDRTGIVDVLTRLPSATLSAAKWELLVRAALLSQVPTNILWHALASPPLKDLPMSYAGKKPGGWGPRHTIATLILMLQQDDPMRVRTWLLQTAGALDEREYADIWRDSDLSAAELRKLLSTRTGETIGEGLVPALLRKDADAIGPLLNDPRTREATLHALTTDPDLRVELRSALATAGSAPEADTLKRLLGSEGVEPFSLLDEASANWSIDERRTLWRRVAGCAREDDQRRAWKRLVALGG